MDTENIRFTVEMLQQLPYHKGPLNAKIAFIGEAPGRDEVLDPDKRAFIGAAGQELDRMLRSVGINPEECYFTNVLKERPPGNDFAAWVRSNPKGLDVYKQLLGAELALLNGVNVFVPLGAWPLRVLCGKDGIENWRGSILPATLTGIAGKKCIASIHPAAILRTWLYRPAVIVDLQRIKEEQETKEIVLPERHYIIRPTYEQATTFLHYLKTETGLISIDVETLRGQIVSIQFCINPKIAICIPFQYRNGNSYWPLEQEVMLWKIIADLLENCGRRIIGQNFLTFDTFMFAAHGLKWDKIIDNVYIDTMEAFRCLQPQLPASLGFLTSIYTREPYYKSEGKQWGSREGEDEFWTYGCKDVMTVAEIAPQLRQELEEEELFNFYEERYYKMAKPRMSMSVTGLKLDAPKRLELANTYRKTIMYEQAKLNVLAGINLNVKSFPQMSKFLYETMKLPPVYKQGKVTTDEDALLELSAKHPSEAFEHILHVRGDRTLYSSNILVRTDSDGRIRSSFGFTETGRFTSSQCPLGTGCNQQNWKVDMRVMIIPDSPDECLIEIDLAQADARVVFYRARDEEAIKIFESGEDFHTRNATLIFHIPKEQVDKTRRYTAKRTVHAANYGMQPPRFAQVYNKDAADNRMPLIDIQTAGTLLHSYHTAVPLLRGIYQAEIKEIITQTRTLHNPLGRRIIFHDRLDERLFKQGYAWYAQSTVADVINIIFQRIFGNPLMKVLLQVHDSLLVQCHKSVVPDVVALLTKAAHVVVPIEGRELVIPAEVKVGDPGASWKDLKPYSMAA